MTDFENAKFGYFATHRNEDNNTLSRGHWDDFSAKGSPNKALHLENISTQAGQERKGYAKKVIVDSIEHFKKLYNPNDPNTVRYLASTKSGDTRHPIWDKLKNSGYPVKEGKPDTSHNFARKTKYHIDLADLTKEGSIVPSAAMAVMLAGGLTSLVPAFKHLNALRKLSTVEADLKNKGISTDSVSIPDGVNFAKNSEDLSVWHSGRSRDDSLWSSFFKRGLPVFVEKKLDGGEMWGSLGGDDMQKQRQFQKDNRHIADALPPGHRYDFDLYAHEKNKPMVYVNEKHKDYGGPVLQHELGHYLQNKDPEFMQKMIELQHLKDTKPQDYYNKVIKDPKQSELYSLEHDAWRRTPYLEDNIAKIPLESYEALSSRPKYLNRSGKLYLLGGLINSAYQGKELGKKIAKRYNKDEKHGEILGAILGSGASLLTGHLLGKGLGSNKFPHLNSIGQGFGNAGTSFLMQYLNHKLDSEELKKEPKL